MNGNKTHPPSVPYSKVMSEFYNEHPKIAIAALNEAIKDKDHEFFRIMLGHIIRNWGSVAKLIKSCIREG